MNNIRTLSILALVSLAGSQSTINGMYAAEVEDDLYGTGTKTVQFAQESTPTAEEKLEAAQAHYLEKYAQQKNAEDALFKAISAGDLAMVKLLLQTDTTDSTIAPGDIYDYHVPGAKIQFPPHKEGNSILEILFKQHPELVQPDPKILAAYQAFLAQYEASNQ